MAERDLLEGFLNCHVCSETSRDPVSLSCYHIFCPSCLQKFWKQAKTKNCPICKRRSSKDFPNVNFVLKELADFFAWRQISGSSETEKGEKEVVCIKHQDPKLLSEDEDRALCPVSEFSLLRSHKMVPTEQAASELKEQLKSDSKSLQEKRDKHEQVVETYSEVIQHPRKQLRAEFKMLHWFLEEEEESTLKALREEEEQKGKIIIREMQIVSEQISSLSDSISTVEEDLQRHSVAFLCSYKPTRTIARVQCLLSHPQGALIDVAKHLGNLSFRVWERMKDKVHLCSVILDPNTAYSQLYLSDDLTRCGDTKQQPADNPERSTHHSDIHGSEGFSLGKYREVGRAIKSQMNTLKFAWSFLVNV